MVEEKAVGLAQGRRGREIDLRGCSLTRGFRKRLADGFQCQRLPARHVSSQVGRNYAGAERIARRTCVLEAFRQFHRDRQGIIGRRGVQRFHPVLRQVAMVARTDNL